MKVEIIATQTMKFHRVIEMPEDHFEKIKGNHTEENKLDDEQYNLINSYLPDEFDDVEEMRSVEVKAKSQILIP